MLEVADVFRLYGDAYLKKFGHTMLPSHRRALADIRHCRTEVFGGQGLSSDQSTQPTLKRKFQLDVHRDFVQPEF